MALQSSVLALWHSGLGYILGRWLVDEGLGRDCVVGEVDRLFGLDIDLKTSVLILLSMTY